MVKVLLVVEIKQKLTGHQAGNKVLSSPSGNYGVMSTGYTGTMVSTKHDAYLETHESPFQIK
jgi:hypothetical protein